MDVDEDDGASAPSKKRKVAGSTDNWKERAASGEVLRLEDIDRSGIKKLRAYLRAMGCEVPKQMASDVAALRQKTTEEFEKRQIREWHA